MANKLLPYELLQMYRARMGSTQADLAAQLGLSSKRMVQYWEAGTYLPKADSLKKLIKVFLQHHIFLAGQEQEEARQLWKAVKEASDTRLDSLTPYPVFDEGWFVGLLDSFPAAKLQLLSLPLQSSPLKATQALLHNLPVQLTSFIGREPEIAQVKRLVIINRLLTLTGVGGTGKTRLAVASAEELLPDFRDGVYFVALENVTERTTLISTLAQTLQIKESATQELLTSLKNFLRERQLLLVLDNFEQLVAKGATLLPELLAAAPELKMLVTSRERLRLSQEKEYTIEPLALPQNGKTAFTPVSLAEYGAVALFVERAQTAKPDFCLNEESLATVAEICRELDGLPLAIELAAARVKLLSPARLLERLAHRLKVLVGGARDLSPRQQTLRGAIDWSYELLEPGEQQLFRRVAIFAGGCTLESAEAVCNSEGDLGIEVLDGLEALVNKSLLKPHEDATGEMRFRMLPTIREYGLEKLSEQAEFERSEQAYLIYFVNLAAQSDNWQRGAIELSTLKELDSEYENLREVLYQTIARPFPELAWHLGGALGLYWRIRGYLSEGRQYLERVLALTSSDQIKAYRLKAVYWISWLATMQGDFHLARVYAEESLALGREISDRLAIANILNSLGTIAVNQGEYAQAQSYFEEERSLEGELADKVGGNFQIGLGLTTLEQAEYAQAQSYFEESLALGRKSEDTRRIAFSLGYLGIVASRQGEYAQAQNYLEAGLAWSRELHDKWVMNMSLVVLGMVATNQGEYSKAQSYLEESLALAEELGDKRGISYALAGTIFLIGKQGNSSKDSSNQASKHLKWIACLGGATAKLLSTLKIVLIQPWRSYYEQGMEAARVGLGEEAFALAFAVGQAMSMEEVTRFTMTIKLTE